MVKFFSPEEEAAIIGAIRSAERASSGEIRVHVEVGAEVPALDVARRIFQELGMHETKDRNGVLILLSVDRREFAIIGDEGIDKVVSEDFWETERDLLQRHFRKGEFAAGLALAIEQVGTKLRKFFPYTGDDITNSPTKSVTANREWAS